MSMFDKLIANLKETRRTIVFTEAPMPVFSAPPTV